MKGLSLDTLLSPRVRRIIELLWALHEESPDEKIVVASRLVRFLDLVQEAMIRVATTAPALAVAVGTATFSGHIDTNDRIENIRLFNQAASGPIVLFLSAAAGGAGLNIATASQLIIYKPQFSPGSEVQVIGCVHRLP